MPKRLEPHTSAYLDACRVIACLVVVVGHVGQRIDGWPEMHGLTRAAVMAFFVISGAVIYNSAARGAGSLGRYASARALRIYSVAVPGIWVSVAIAALYPDWRERIEPATIALAHVFYTQSWWSMRDIPLNGPFWSLCYEVWYYAIFGLAFYLRGPLRYLCAATAAFIAGPAIMALMPVWLMGVAVVRYGGTWRIPRPTIVWCISMAALSAFGASGVDLQIRAAIIAADPRWWFLGSAQRFITDPIFGLLFALGILAVAQGRLFDLSAPWVRWAAHRTYSVYLFHMPVVILADRALPPLPSIARATALLAIALGASVALAQATEVQALRYRAVMRVRPA